MKFPGRQAAPRGIFLLGLNIMALSRVFSIKESFATGFLDFTGFQEPPFFSPVFVLLYSGNPEFVPVSAYVAILKPLVLLAFRSFFPSALFLSYYIPATLNLSQFLLMWPS